MNHSTLLVSALVLLILSSFLFGQTPKWETDWDAFSKNLVIAVKSGHPGLQQSAMQRIIQHKDKLDVSEAVYDIGQIFRFDDNPQMRRLAMVTLHAINTDKALAIVSNYLKFEDEPCIQKQGCCALNSYALVKSSEETDGLTAMK